MSQQPHYNPQQLQGMPPRQNVNLHAMLDHKPPGNPGAGGMGIQQNFPNIPQAPPQEKTIIDDFEAAFQSCIAPLMPGSDNMGGMTMSPEKLRSSVEHSIQNFTEQARKVEAYFLRMHAMVAQRQPELILQEEIEELKVEISRRDSAIQNHATKVVKWQENLRNLQKTISEQDSAGTTSHPNPQTTLPQQVGMVHPDMMQQMGAQRR